MLSVVMTTAVMLSVFLLNVVAPCLAHFTDKMMSLDILKCQALHRRHDIQYNDTLANDIQHNDSGRVC
jgi:hypothetical protein